MHQCALLFCVAVSSIFMPGNAGLLPKAAAAEPNPSAAIMDQLSGAGAAEVAKAVGMALAGKTDTSIIAPVRFETPAAAPKVDPFLQSRDFQWITAIVGENNPQKKDSRERTIKGMQLYMDAYGRAVFKNYTAIYTAARPDDLIVHQVRFSRLTPGQPRVFLYFIPAGAIIPGLIQKTKFKNLLKYAVKTAVPVSEGKTIDKQVREYYVLAFFMDRIDENAKVRLDISGLDAIEASQIKASSIRDDGWHVAYARARFALDGARRVTFRVYFHRKQKDESGPPEEILAAEFDSNVSKAFSILVQQVQKRLAQNGYDCGPANGRLNRQTQNAIKKFQQDRNIRVDGKVSVALRDYIKNIFPVSETSVQPATSSKDKIKVMKLQHWLRYLGYDPGPVNGVMSAKTKEAIKLYQLDRAIADNKRQRAEAGFKTKAESTEKSGKPASRMDVAAIQKQFKGKMWPNQIVRQQKPETAEGYALFPEPMMFVVPAGAIRSKKLPGNYAELMRFVGERAVSPGRATKQKREYFIFVFLKNAVSPSSELGIKISNSKSGDGGIDKGLKTVYLNRRHVAYISGKMTLADPGPKALVYFKVLFTPGKEVGFFSRSQQQVGLFASDGS
jgi:hypothetical protein